MNVPNEQKYRKKLYARTPFSAKVMALLWSFRVGIVGAGSGGSALALAMARAGVGEIRIADPQKLELANISRHELGLPHLDKNKAEAVAQRISEINPYIKTNVFPSDLFADDAERGKERFFDGLDLIIGSTDKTAVQLAINREGVDRGIAMVFGGCYESARGGEVLFWLPGKNMPCLECLRGGLTQPEQTGKIDYSTATSPDDYEGEPGLHAAINLITNIEAEIALAVLLHNEPSSELGKIINPTQNYLLIGGTRANGFYRFRKAFDIFWQPLTGPRTDCGACQSSASEEVKAQAQKLLDGELSNIPDVFC